MIFQVNNNSNSGINAPIIVGLADLFRAILGFPASQSSNKVLFVADKAKYHSEKNPLAHNNNQGDNPRVGSI